MSFLYSVLQSNVFSGFTIILGNILVILEFGNEYFMDGTKFGNIRPLNLTNILTGRLYVYITDYYFLLPRV